MPAPRQELLRLLAHKSFKLGDFKLSSGGTSDYYIDCRTTTLDARGSQLTGQVFLDEIRKRGWQPQAIGGLTMGADPIVVAVSVTSGELNGFLVRKAEKQHGTGQRIEGFRQKGRQSRHRRRCLHNRSIYRTGHRSRPRIRIRSCRRDVPGRARGSRRSSQR